MATKAEVTTAEAMMVVVTLAAEMAVVETEEAIDMGVERPLFDHPLRRVPWR